MASVTQSELARSVPNFLQTCYVTTLVPNTPFNVTLLGPSGLSPKQVSHSLHTEATTRDPVFLKWDESLNDTTNNTITLEPDTVSGGDITGATIRVYIEWTGAGSGGIS